MKTPPDLQNPIDAIQKLAADLRDPKGGCPWDIKQDHKSMIKHLVEESYEVVDALQDIDEQEEKSFDNLKKELGDLLFQVVFHAQLAREKERFDLDDIARSITEKLIFRHPHVYGSEEAETSEKVLTNWEQLKRKEREAEEDEFKSMLSGIPRSMPALQKSYRMGQKVARVNFDWPVDGREQIVDKINEEIGELTAELPEQGAAPSKRAKEEFGDLLFVLCQLARHMQINPEEALEGANKKFQTRFAQAEQVFRERLDAGDHPSLEEWDAEWDRVKAAE